MEGTWLWEAARLTFAVAHIQDFDIGNVEVQMKCLGMIAGEFSPHPQCEAHSHALLANGLVGSRCQVGFVEGFGFLLQHGFFYAWDASAWFRSGWLLMNTLSGAPYVLPACFAVCVGGARYGALISLLAMSKRAFPLQDQPVGEPEVMVP